MCACVVDFRDTDGQYELLHEKTESRQYWEVIGHILHLMEIHDDGSNEQLVELLKYSQTLYSKGHRYALHIN